MDSKAFLIVGLGNPGDEYAHTRHNIGCELLAYFAKEKSVEMKKCKYVDGIFGKMLCGEKVVYLLFPTTYMNLSGSAVKKCLEKNQIAISHLIVLVDDIYLPFGKFRMRTGGGAGGHNGLKSIESVVGTQYSRLRIGVGQSQDTHLATYVLAKFSSKEQVALPLLLKKGGEILDKWIETGTAGCMQFANAMIGEEKSHDTTDEKKSL